MRNLRGKGPVGLGLLSAVFLIGWALANPGPGLGEAADDIFESSDDLPLAFPTDVPLPDDLGLGDLGADLDKDALRDLIREQIEDLAAEYLAEYDPPSVVSRAAEQSPSYEDLLDGDALRSLLAGGAGATQDAASMEDLLAIYQALTAESNTGSGGSGSLGPSLGVDTGLPGSLQIGSKGELQDEYEKFSDDLAEAFSKIAGEFE